MNNDRKLVNLPSEVWENLRQQGYHIPLKGFNLKQFLQTKVKFKFLIDVLSNTARELLLFNLLQKVAPMSDITAERISNAYDSQTSGRRLFRFYARKLQEAANTVHTVPSKEPDPINEVVPSAEVEEIVSESVETLPETVKISVPTV